ncbi:small heat shock protein [Agrocybe pediades]|nr:small heat shock protein [Agrocybe pediades]
MSIFNIYESFYDFDRIIDDALNAIQSKRSGSNSNSDSRAVQRREVDDNLLSRPLRPRMDLSEDSAKNLVTATFELPGLKKDDVQIDVNNNRLTISGEAQKSSEHDEGGYAVRERRYGRFSRTLQLPQGVKDSDIKASLDNGALTVNFPKSSEEQAHKRIAIN